MSRTVRCLLVMALLCAWALPAAAVQPAQGFWKSDYRPGVGMYLQLRGGTVAVALLDFRDGRPRWRIGTGPLAGDTAELRVHGFADGSCLGCAPHIAPVPEGEGVPLRLQFESARQAIATVDGDEQTWLTPLPYGGGYLPVWLDEWFFNPYGMLPTPDLHGNWAVGSHATGYFILEVGEAEIGPVGVNFTAQRDYPPAELQVQCLPASDEWPAGCHLMETEPPRRLAFARLGDISTSQVRFSPEPGGAAAAMMAVRLVYPEYDGDPVLSPAPGFWVVPGKPGTGMVLQHAGNALGVSLLDFAATAGRHSYWSLGGAPGGTADVVAAMADYSGHNCFDCAADSTAQSVPHAQRDLRLAFDSARSAELTIAGSPAVHLANLDFGVEYLPPSLFASADGLLLPDLKGTWALPVYVPDFAGAFTLTQQGATILTLDTGPYAVGTLTRFRGTYLGSTATLDCDPTQGLCRLGVPGIEDPTYQPVARIGDIEPDRIRFSVLAIGVGEAREGAFHAVRIPAAGD